MGKLIRSEIYAEAARLHEAGEGGCDLPDCPFSCCTLSRLCPKDDDNATYDSVHRPYADLYAEADWWNRLKGAVPHGPENRILALCFMAALAEDEEAEAEVIRAKEKRSVKRASARRI